MVLSRESVLQEAMKLSADDRYTLAHQLWLSLQDEPIDPEIEAAWIAEAERRMEAHQRGEIETVDVYEAIHEIRSNLKERRAGA